MSVSHTFAYCSERCNTDQIALRASLLAFQSFVLLGGRDFILAQAQPVSQCLEKSVGRLADVHASSSALDVLDLVLRLCPEMAQHLVVPLQKTAADAVGPSVRRFSLFVNPVS